MTANKLVAALNRVKVKGYPAGRDFFDLRSFFYQGLPIKQSIVEKRTGQKYQDYLLELLDYVKTKLTPLDLYQDLNSLLPSHNFKYEVDQIIPDLMLLLQNEIKRQV